MLTEIHKHNPEYKLSIITINRNDANGLKKTIDSVISQSGQNFEFIVIDGASQDKSVSIIQDNVEHIDYWVSEEDSGIYNAMNKGMAVAKGEYCLFLNSGDFLYNSSVIATLLNLELTDDIISFGCKIDKSNGSYINSPPRTVSLYTFTRGSLCHPSTLIKTSILQQNRGYDENYKILSDWKFFLEALIIDKCTYSSNADIVLTIFDGINGISSTSAKMEASLATEILKKKFPKILDDYYVDHSSFEYFLNVYNFLLKNTFLFKISFFLVKVFNRIFKCRKDDTRLSTISKI